MTRRSALALIFTASALVAHSGYRLNGRGWSAEFAPGERLLRIGSSVIRMDLVRERPWAVPSDLEDRIRYRNVYAGIHLDYFRRGADLEFGFLVEPGADPRNIVMSFGGVRQVWFDGSGNMVLETPSGRVWQKAPVAYQIDWGRRYFVRSRFVQVGPREVALAVGNYNPRLPLVIE